MTNLLKEIGRRVTLTDLVEDSEKINQFLEPLDEGRVKKWYKIGGYFNLALRGVVRIIGDTALVYYANEAYQNQEITPLVSGTVICLFAYLLDYYSFDRMDSGYWKNNDSP